MKDFLRKIWNWLVGLLYKIPFDKYLHFIGGMVVASFFALAIGDGWALICVVPALMAGLLKEMFDVWTTGTWEWWDVGATAIGGAVPWLFALLGLLI